ncbi:MAG TPA: LytTR family DNA-binding domain-containing protein [Candidatus Acidoferrum sp.]|nr:LytTR family DNA-binding domain-containing protein [Candidatus Acidoferrum sp.]
MRVMVLADEPLARTTLENVVAQRIDVEDFACAGDAVEALDKFQNKPYDVVLIDVDIMRNSDFEFVALLNKQNGPQPAIIVITPYYQDTLPVFNRNTIDYVLKPFSDQRIHEALNIAARRTANERATSLMEILSRLKNLVPRPLKIAIKSEGKILFLEPAEITAIEAQRNYALLQGPSGTYLLRESISALAEKLKPYGFIRIHRSVLVNTACIQEIEPSLAGEYLLRTTEGKEYAVSRTYKRNLRFAAHIWMGGDELFAE